MIRAKKSLGQNFLIDKNIINKIVKVLNIQNRNILEIGPGTGNLTCAILKENPKKMIVIEKDSSLANLLKKKFDGKIDVINNDILKVNENNLYDQTLTVYGNLPYNISTEILCKWILNKENQNWFDYLVLMFQKEVADRIISTFNTRNYGRLTILSNWKLDIKKICDIKPSSFDPIPKVDSTILLFKAKKKFLILKNPKNLEKITRIFFMHRRKMIKKPYQIIFGNNKKVAQKLGINLSLRPQNLDLDKYFELTKEYEYLRY